MLTRELFALVDAAILARRDLETHPHDSSYTDRCQLQLNLLGLDPDHELYLRDSSGSTIGIVPGRHQVFRQEVVDYLIEKVALLEQEIDR